VRGSRGASNLMVVPCQIRPATFQGFRPPVSGSLSYFHTISEPSLEGFVDPLWTTAREGTVPRRTRASAHPRALCFAFHYGQVMFGNVDCCDRGAHRQARHGISPAVADDALAAVLSPTVAQVLPSAHDHCWSARVAAERERDSSRR